MAVDKGSFDSLFAWIHTFVTPEEKLQYEDLIEQTILFDVLKQMDLLPLWAEPLSDCADQASQIHNASILFAQLLYCYSESLSQTIMLPMLDLMAYTNYKEDSAASQQEMHKLLMLLLGIAIQCKRKDEFIAVMETLPDSTQEDIMENYKTLTKHLVRLDAPSSDLGIGNTLRRCCDDRLECFKKYSEAVEEKCYLETVLLASQATTTGGDAAKAGGGSDGGSPGLQELLDSANQQAATLSAQLENKTAEAERFADKLRREKDKVERLKAAAAKANTSGGQGVKISSLNDEIDRLRDKIQKFENLEKEVYTLRQRQTEFDFYKSRVQDLRTENSQLIEDRQRFEELLASSRRKEEDVIERLVESDMRFDKLTGQREADAERARQALETVDRLEAENRRLRESATTTAAPSAASVAATAAELASAARIRELEAELERLRASAPTTSASDEKQERWKFLEVKKDLVQTRRELAKARKEQEADSQRARRLETQLEAAFKAGADRDQELAGTKQSHEEHVRDLERRIHELTNQIVLLKRKGSEAMKGLREAELAEMEVMFQSVQELTSQVARLKNNNKILRQSCDKLKSEVYKIFTIEQENERLLAENRELRKVKAAESTAQDEWELVRRKNLQLEVENKKLRRICESLKMTLVQIDPYNKMRYSYITSL